MNLKDIIYDWNIRGHAISPSMPQVNVHDETLRDGIQSPSVYDPSIEDKFEIVRLMNKVGIYSTNVGLPGAGPRAVADSEALVTLMRDEKMNIKPGCAARTLENDIRPIIEISERTGVPIEIMTFLGSSPIRMYAESWDEAKLEQLTRDAVKLGIAHADPRERCDLRDLSFIYGHEKAR